MRGCVVMGGIEILLIAASGLVFAGLVHSAWAIASGRQASFELLFEPSAILPIKAMVVVTAAPVLLIITGLNRLTSPGGTIMWWAYFATAMTLCFIQGVVILVGVGILG